MPLTHLLFSFHGRIGRLQFWCANIVILVLLFVISGLLLGSAFTGIDTSSPAAGRLVLEALMESMGAMFPFLLVYFWVSFALAAKRFHDRNHSAWWLIPYVIISIVPYVQFIAWICYFIEIGCRAGTPGSNRFDVDTGPRVFKDDTEITASWADNLDVVKLAREGAAEEYQPKILRKRKPAVERVSGNAGFGRRTKPA